MASAAVKGLVKVGIAAGALYVTFDQGVWSNTPEASSSLQRIRTRYLPDTNEYLNQIPSKDDVRDKVTDTWNGGVQKTFGGLAATPDMVTDYSKKAVTQVKNNLMP